MTGHDNFGCLTAEDSGIPNLTDEPGKIHQCGCGRWWVIRESTGFVVWRHMTDSEKAEHVPGQIGTHDAEGYRTHAPPGDVCVACSDSSVGHWVPVSQCALALAAFERQEREFEAAQDEIVQAVERRQGEPAGYNPANIGKRESSDGVSTITVYVSIGNSDGKLSQRDWATFIREMTSLVRDTADQVYGWWHSTSDMPWQNAVVAFLLNAGKRDQLRAEVSRLREKYRQDSIAWAEAPRTDFI